MGNVNLRRKDTHFVNKALVDASITALVKTTLFYH
jgi:hypothetical protein